MQFAGRMLANAIVLAFHSWWTMILLGILHNENSAFPALGFGATFTFVVMVTGLVSAGVFLARD